MFRKLICNATIGTYSKSLLLNNSNRIIDQTRYISFKNLLNPFKYYQENADTSAKKRVQKELNQGVLWDVREFVNNPNMKLFVGSPKLTPLASSQDLPEIKTSDLYGNSITVPQQLSQTKPSLLCVTLKPFHSNNLVASWSEPFKAQFPNIDIHHVVLVQQTGYRLLSPFLKRTRRDKNKNVIESWSNQPIDIRGGNDLLETLSITNPFGSYIYLIMDGKIRWKSSGKSTPEELEYLFKNTQSLIDNPNSGTSKKLESTTHKNIQ
ncbi:hypothetical protein DLAC_00559 [Tieghemostelium lacteum]|uniref:Uncharacterized protein n=1 Tax=Tieghemostelium lacteum TaxID=361077 RepID=A0A152AAG6_TIELA|nr:hypothetical protein DLAC_00559 [Tieghemostelium lacteum]|eukprot:KYR03067.1 hypothetical protein DLAC_00559 [Tieghemostelium lacteum]